MGLTDNAAVGRTTRLTAAKESTWGTGIAVTDLITYLTENMTRNQQNVLAEYHASRVGLEDADPTTIDPRATITFEAAFDRIAGDPIGWELFLLAAMGTATWDAANSLNQYTMADTLSTSLTLAAAKTVSIWEMIGAKVTALELAGNMDDGKVIGTVELLGKNLLRTGDAGIVNTTTTVNTNITPTAKPPLVLVKDAIFRIDTLGSALAAADQFGISSFRLRIENALTENDYATPENTGHTNATHRLEPIRNNIRRVMLEVDVKRYTTDDPFDWVNAGTNLQCDLKFSRGSDELNILIPVAKVLEEPSAPVEGPGAVIQAFKLDAIINNGTNTDLEFQDSTAISKELGIEVKSTRTAAP